jgi:hypothetical protein
VGDGRDHDRDHEPTGQSDADDSRFHGRSRRDNRPGADEDEGEGADELGRPAPEGIRQHGEERIRAIGQRALLRTTG